MNIKAVLIGLVVFSLTASIQLQAEQKSPTDYSEWGGAFTQEEGDRLWENLASSLFGERELIEGEAQRVIKIKAPSRAENDALVPVQISTELPSGLNSTLKHVYLTVDINPSPVAAKFTVSPVRDLGGIATRVRVNGYTYIRAIAEMSDGTLYMDKQWVKSRGAGCSAPPGTNQEDAKVSLGKMRFKFSQPLGGDSVGQSKVVQLMISHPNNTGMQRDQLSTMFIPQSYVKEVDVSFNNESILRAETSFTISENPSFRFKFDPDESGELVARMKDTDDREFFLYQSIKASE